MRTLRSALFVAAVAAAASSLAAQTGSAGITFNTAPGAPIGVTIASAYKATWTGTLISATNYPGGALDIFCVDLLDNVGYGQTWNAWTQNLGGTVDASKLRWGAESNALVRYRQAAWMSDQFAGRTAAQQKELQTAIWRTFTYAKVDNIPDGTGYGDASVAYANVTSWMAQAAAFESATAATDNYWDKFVVISDKAMMIGASSIESSVGAGDWRLRGGTQEFLTISEVPEPASLALMATGMLGLAFVGRRRSVRVG